MSNMREPKMTKEKVEALMISYGWPKDQFVWRDNRSKTYQQVYDAILKILKNLFQ